VRLGALIVDSFAWLFCRHRGPQHGQWLAAYGVAVYRCRNCDRVVMRRLPNPARSRSPA
jgi:hypothetical protein